jgi:hypothetical protein
MNLVERVSAAGQELRQSSQRVALSGGSMLLKSSLRNEEPPLRLPIEAL